MGCRIIKKYKTGARKFSKVWNSFWNMFNKTLCNTTMSVRFF